MKIDSIVECSTLESVEEALTEILNLPFSTWLLFQCTFKVKYLKDDAFYCTPSCRNTATDHDCDNCFKYCGQLLTPSGVRKWFNSGDKEDIEYIKEIRISIADNDASICYKFPNPKLIYEVLPEINDPYLSKKIIPVIDEFTLEDQLDVIESSPYRLFVEIINKDKDPSKRHIPTIVQPWHIRAFLKEKADEGDIRFIHVAPIMLSSEWGDIEEIIKQYDDFPVLERFDTGTGIPEEYLDKNTSYVEDNNEKEYEPELNIQIQDVIRQLKELPEGDVRALIDVIRRAHLNHYG